MELNYRHTFCKARLLFFVLFCSILFACNGNTTSKISTNSLSLAEEQEFWDKWKNEHKDADFVLEPICVMVESGLLKEINDEIVKVCHLNDTFILIIRTNANEGKLDVVLLSKGQAWQVHKWDLQGGSLKNPTNLPCGVPENLVSVLSGTDVYVDSSDGNVCDADSIYVYLSYQNIISRFAIYNPKFPASKETHNYLIAKSLMSLLKCIGMDYTEDKTDGKDIHSTIY